MGGEEGADGVFVWVSGCEVEGRAADVVGLGGGDGGLVEEEGEDAVLVLFDGEVDGCVSCIWICGRVLEGCRSFLSALFDEVFAPL